MLLMDFKILLELSVQKVDQYWRIQIHSDIPAFLEKFIVHSCQVQSGKAERNEDEAWPRPVFSKPAVSQRHVLWLSLLGADRIN